jgi:type III pantothenate kinase
MIIVGDIGNTETKICLVNSQKKIVKRISLNTKKISISLLSKSIKKFNFKLKNIEKCLFCSVVPKSYKLIEFFFNKFLKIKCYELKDLNLKSLINIKVNKKQVGSDRLSNAISLMNNKKNFIILDFGTATTFDVLIKNYYHGGIIAPGINISLNTLIDKATLIPKINLKKMKKVIGSNTISAVRSGFFWGYIGLIDNIVNLIKKETKKPFKLIITGGLAHLFKNSLSSSVTINKDITIKGLIKASDLIK